jgi:hypothetical protein
MNFKKNIQNRGTLNIGDIVTIRTELGNKQIKITSFNNNNILGHETGSNNLGGASKINSYPISLLKLHNNNNNIKIYDPFGAIFNKSIYANKTTSEKFQFNPPQVDFKSINRKVRNQKMNEYFDKWSNDVISIIFKQFKYNNNKKMPKKMINWINKCIFRLKSFQYWFVPIDAKIGLKFYEILDNKLENILQIEHNTILKYDYLLDLIKANNKDMINNIIKLIINKYKNKNKNKELINIKSECYTLNKTLVNNLNNLNNFNNFNNGNNVNNVNNVNSLIKFNDETYKNMLQKSLIKSIIYELHNIKCYLYKYRFEHKSKKLTYLPDIISQSTGLLGDETEWKNFHKHGLFYDTNKMQHIFFIGYFYSIITQIDTYLYGGYNNPKSVKPDQFQTIFNELKTNYPNIIRAGILFLRYKLLAESLIKQNPLYGTNILEDDDLITDFRNIMMNYFTGGTGSIIDAAINIFFTINFSKSIKTQRKYGGYEIKDISQTRYYTEMKKILDYISGVHLENILNNLENIFIFYIPEISNHL